MIPTIEINGRTVGRGHRVYVVAEMSANHQQKLETALAILAAAKNAGADAVKLQTYTPDTLTIDCDAECFQIAGTLWRGRTLYDLYREASLPWEWHAELKAAAERFEIDLFSTPFDASAIDYLEDLEIPAFKVASFELTDIPLLRRVARTGKPVLLSTGMATLGEIEEAVNTLRESGCKHLALLKCTSAYPASPGEMNLVSIAHLAETFGVPVGISDHTLGGVVPAVSVALGACIVEKHFTLSRSEPGLDSAFSLEPDEFRAMVEGIRVAEAALGTIHYGLTSAERESRVFRRSLFVVRDLRQGEPFTAENVRSIRPSHGLHPRHLDVVLASRARCDIRRGTPLRWDLIAQPERSIDPAVDGAAEPLSLL